MKIDQLYAGYGKKEVLSDLQYTFSRNKITAIVGQSGCGKSTFLKCLNRMIEQEGGWMRGEHYLAGENTKKYNREDLRHRVGMVSQQPIVFPFSIEKNLKCVFDYYKIPRSRQKEETIRVLQQVKLFEEIHDRLHEPARKLSGGQKQRLAIARALCAQPEILLLDEPCSALDLKNTIAIEEMLLESLKSYTIIIVTHNLAQAKRIADEIVFMHDGKIIEATEKNQFFTSPQTELAREQIQYM